MGYSLNQDYGYHYVMVQFYSLQKERSLSVGRGLKPLDSRLILIYAMCKCYNEENSLLLEKLHVFGIGIFLAWYNCHVCFGYPCVYSPNECICVSVTLKCTPHGLKEIRQNTRYNNKNAKVECTVVYLSPLS